VDIDEAFAAPAIGDLAAGDVVESFEIIGD
jgi:hypothetical protein